MSGARLTSSSVVLTLQLLMLFSLSSVDAAVIADVNQLAILTCSLANKFNIKLDKPVGELARALRSLKRLLLSVDVVSNDILSSPANFKPPTRASLFCTARCSCLRHEKCRIFCRSAVAPNASSPRVLSRMS